MSPHEESAAADAADVVRRYAKYVFLDVVQFSKRSAEAQSDIVRQLNDIVARTLADCGVSTADCIMLPTGDGMCVALIGTDLPYDVHVRAALRVLHLLSLHNATTASASRRFEVRIGVNQNTDILVTDINGRRNIAGAGINMAARIMAQGDGSQILVSQTVFEELQPSEKYMGGFRPFAAEAKHGLRFQVFQYVADHVGLNVETPAAFAPPAEPARELRLPRAVAYYLALAVRNRARSLALYRESSTNQHALQVLLWLLAKDADALANATEFRPAVVYSKDYGRAGFSESFDYYNAQDISIIHMLSQTLTGLLSEYDPLFELSDPLSRIFVAREGERVLREQWPAVWREFELDRFARGEDGGTPPPAAGG